VTKLAVTKYDVFSITLSLSICALLAGLPTFPAQGMQVILQDDVTSRLMNHRVLVPEAIIPAGTLVEIPDEEMHNAKTQTYSTVDRPLTAEVC